MNKLILERNHIGFIRWMISYIKSSPLLYLDMIVMSFSLLILILDLLNETKPLENYCSKVILVIISICFPVATYFIFYLLYIRKNPLKNEYRELNKLSIANKNENIINLFIRTMNCYIFLLLFFQHIKNVDDILTYLLCIVAILAISFSIRYLIRIFKIIMKNTKSYSYIPLSNNIFILGCIKQEVLESKSLSRYIVEMVTWLIIHGYNIHSLYCQAWTKNIISDVFNSIQGMRLSSWQNLGQTNIYPLHNINHLSEITDSDIENIIMETDITIIIGSKNYDDRDGLLLSQPYLDIIRLSLTLGNLILPFNLSTEIAQQIKNEIDNHIQLKHKVFSKMTLNLYNSLIFKELLSGKDVENSFKNIKKLVELATKE